MAVAPGTWLGAAKRILLFRGVAAGQTAEQVRLGPVRRLHLLMIGLFLGLMLAVGAIAVRQHSFAIDEAARDLRILTRAVSSETERTFQAIDLVLSHVAERAAAIQVGAFDPDLGKQEVHLWLQGSIAGLPQMHAVAIINSQGKLINFSRRWPIPDIDVSDRDYFKALSGRTDQQTFVGAPARDRAAGAWTIYLARRLNGPGGEFAGLALGAIQVGYLDQAYRDIAEGEGTTLALLRDDNLLLARHPHTELVGRTFAEFGNPDLRTSYRRGLSPVDQRQRIEVAQQVSRFPLLVKATVTEEQALQGWRQEAVVLILVAAALAVALWATARALGRLWVQDARLALAEAERQRAEAALASQQEKLSTLGALQAAKEEAERLQAAAEAASHAKSAFLAMMSHELRTPLNAVIGFAEVMQMEAFGKLGNDQYREYTGYIIESGRHLLAVINDILDLSKAEAEKIDLRVESMDLAGMATEVCTLMRREAAQAGLTLDQAAPGGDTALRADPQRVRQIVLNLVSNAIKFTGKEGTVTVSVTGNDKGVTLAVQDTGIGMSPADLAQVFRPFVQADSSLARKREGTGLGLPLARLMARLHGGDVTLRSELGHGTTAELFLPRVPAAKAERPGLSAAA